MELAAPLGPAIAQCTLATGFDLAIREIVTVAHATLREAPTAARSIEFVLSWFRHVITPVTLLVMAESGGLRPRCLIGMPGTTPERSAANGQRCSSRGFRRVARAIHRRGASYIAMPRRRERVGPPRISRDTADLADLFVQIDKSVAQRAKDVAKAKNVNLWQVVEEALRALPDIAELEAQPTLMDVPQKVRKAS